MIRNWPGIKRNDQATGPGADYAENTRFYVRGELQRRHGLVKLNAFGAVNCTGIIKFWHPNAGLMVVVADSGGNIQQVAAT